MPNDWELVKGLNKDDPTDRNIIAADGYTMLEKYLNGIEFMKKVEGIALTVTAEDNLLISWANCFMDEDGYIIERAESGADFSVLDSVGPDVTSYLDVAALLSSTYRYRVKAFNESNESLYSSVVTYDPTSSVDGLQDLPGSLKIYPNPARDMAQIEFHLNDGVSVDIAISDMNGRKIRNIANRFYDPGCHTVTWSVTDDAGNAIKPGIYICTVRTGSDFKALKFSVSY
jgi:hypothetical protein